MTTKTKTTVSALAGVTAVIGVLLGLAGGAVLAVFGSDGKITSGDHAVSSETTALVSSVADFDDVDDVTGPLGEPSIQLKAKAVRPGHGVFVGVAKADDIDRYLDKAPIEEVGEINVDPFELAERHVKPGAGRPAKPADQDFWVAQGTGDDVAELDWEVHDGDYRAVVMNADGSRNVEAEASAGVEIPHLPAIAWALLGLGALLVTGAATTAARYGRA